MKRSIQRQQRDWTSFWLLLTFFAIASILFSPSDVSSRDKDQETRLGGEHLHKLFGQFLDSTLITGRKQNSWWEPFRHLEGKYPDWLVSRPLNEHTAREDTRLSPQDFRTTGDASVDWADYYAWGGIVSSDNLADATTDEVGNIIVTGRTDSTFSFVDIMTIKYGPDGAVRWRRRWTSDSANYDVPTAVATDAQGSVYVTGTSFTWISALDFVTIKYDSNGTEQWVRKYNSPWDDWDLATCMGVDDSGNVIVAGGSFNDVDMYDYLVVKYDKNGVEQWVTRLNTNTGYDDGIVALRVDSIGSIYVTGNAYADILTLKLDNGGNQMWGAGYDGPAHFYDEAYHLTLDRDLNVLVTGSSRQASGDEDIVTLKYNPQGNEEWAATYDRTGNGDIGFAATTDENGGVYIAGYSTYCLTCSPDFTVVKYSADGIEEWVRMPGGVHQSFARAICVDQAQNLLVAGSAADSKGVRVLTVKYDPSGNELWRAVYDGPHHRSDIGLRLVLGPADEVYVAGITYDNSTWQDFLLVKYSSGGTLQWARSFDGVGRSEESMCQMEIDGNGNIYLAINARRQNDTSQTQNVIVRKYSPGGSPLWTREYNELELKAMTVDRAGNVYLTGSSNAGFPSQSTKVTTLKYHADGGLQWTQTKESDTAAYDARDITVDSDGNSYVLVAAFNPTTRDDFLLLKYDPYGALIWERQSSSGVSGIEFPKLVAIYNDSVIVLTGYTANILGSPMSVYTLAYSVSGTLLWIAPPVVGIPYEMVVDDQGYTYVAGDADGPNGITIKYHPAGYVAWNRTRGNSTNWAIAVDYNQNVYTTSGDYLIKYGPTGVLQWQQPLTHPYPYSTIKADQCGFVYVGTYRGQMNFKKYDPAGNEIWRIDYQAFYSDENEKGYLSLHGDGSVFFAGSTNFGFGNSATSAYLGRIKQSTTLQAEPSAMGFGPVQLGCSAYDTVTVSSLICLSPDAVSVSHTDPQFTIVPLDPGAPPSNDLQFQIVYSPAVFDSAADTIRFQHTESALAAVLPVSGLGDAQGSGQLVAQIAFDSIGVGCVKETTLIIRNPDCSPSGFQMSSTAPDYSIVPIGVVLAPHESSLLLVRFSPLAGGVRSGQISITNLTQGVTDFVDLSGIGVGNGTEVAIVDSFGTDWQLLSLPVEPVCLRVMHGSYFYEGNYQRTDTLAVGRGYWTKLVNPIVSFAGEGIPVFAIPVSSKWNLIGSISTAVPVTAVSTAPSGIIQSPFYSYYGSSYSETDSLRPGHAYWIRVSQPGTINLQSVSGSEITRLSDQLEPRFSIIRFTDAQGRLQRLYLTEELQERSLGWYELPPAPPEGGFDVRFRSGRSAELLKPGQSECFPISITGAEHPVTIQWENITSRDLTMTLGVVRIEMGDTGSVETSELEIVISVAAPNSTEVPTAYTLEQNFPNPFNPTTTIRYGLPTAGHVRVEVYSMVGELVTTLVDRVVDAGYYSVEFDGVGLASGLYVYRIQAGSFSQSRKLLLLK